MEKKQNLVVGKKGFYGRVIRVFQHNIYIEKNEKYEYESYSYLFQFEDAFFVYQLDMGMDVLTHMFRTVDAAEEFAHDLIESINKEDEMYKQKSEKFRQEIEESAQAVIESYKIAEKQKKSPAFSYFMNALSSVQHVNIEAFSEKLEFPFGITLEKKENGKFKVYEIDIYDRVGAIMKEYEYETIEEAVNSAKDLSIKAEINDTYHYRIGVILEYRNLRNYGIVVEELPYNIFIAIAPTNLVILYRVNEELDVIQSGAFTEIRHARWKADTWIEEIEGNSKS